MKKEVDEFQYEINKVLGIILDTVDNLEDKKMRLTRTYQQAELLKKKEEDDMNYYEITFIGYDGDSYVPETSWIIRSKELYDEMMKYVQDLNDKFRYIFPESRSFFTLKERDVLRGCPEFGRLLNDLKEL
jgi:hypothetical protein